MRILVYGAGAVGGFFGGLLAHAGEDVRFVARGAQREALQASGLTIESRLRGTIVIPSVAVSDSAATGGSVDLILVCVKTQQLAGILDDLSAAVGEQTVIVPLQNGVEADEQLARRFPHATVLPAVVYVGATLDTPGTVSHVAAGSIGIGATREHDHAVLPAIRDLLGTRFAGEIALLLVKMKHRRVPRFVDEGKKLFKRWCRIGDELLVANLPIPPR